MFIRMSESWIQNNSNKKIHFAFEKYSIVCLFEKKQFAETILLIFTFQRENNAWLIKLNGKIYVL